MLANAGTVTLQNGVLDLGGLFDAYSGQYVLITGARSNSGTFSSITGYAGSQDVSYNAGFLNFLKMRATQPRRFF